MKKLKARKFVMSFFTRKNLFLVSATTLSIVFRFLFFNDISRFSHDSARDLVTNYKMLVYGEMPLRGPVFSVVWAHTSLIFHYITFPFYFALNFHPLAPNILTTFINLLTGLIIYFYLSKLYNKISAIFALLLYLFSFSIIVEGSYGLNPVFNQPFTIISTFTLFLLLQKIESRLLIVYSFSLAMLASFHPSGVFLLLTQLLFILVWLFLNRKKITFTQYKVFFRKYFLQVIFPFFIFAFLPYAFMEKKFNFFNTRQLINYFLESTARSSGSTNTINYLSFFSSTFREFAYIFSPSFLPFGYSIFILFLFSIIFTIFLKKSSVERYLIYMFFIYIFLFYSLVGRSSEINSWWLYTVCVPLFVPIFGIIFSKIYSKKPVVPILLFILIVVSNLVYFDKYVPRYDSYNTTKNIADEIRKNVILEDNISITGEASSPYYYTLWYFEREQKQKDYYFTKVKWKNETFDISNKIFVIDNFVTQNRNNLLIQYNKENIKTIYSAGTSKVLLLY